MYKIGEFSRMTSLSIRTLRYYEEVGILPPSHRDKSSGYRFYGEQEYRRARLIKLLRGFNFSIGEIRDVLQHCEMESDLRYYLTEKKKQMNRQISHFKDLIRSIDRFVLQPEQEEKAMTYEIRKQTCESVLVASIRFKGKYEEIGAYFEKLYEAVKSNAAGAPFNLYYDGEYCENDADIEVCVPVKEPVSDGVQCRCLPCFTALTTIHNGPYESLGEAYKALTDYANKNHIRTKSFCREAYIEGPTAKDQNHCKTEIAIEIEES